MMAALRKGSRSGRFTLLSLLLLVLSLQLKAQADFTIGTGTTGNTTTGYPCPIQDRFEGSRAQYLYRESELVAAGMGAGTISHIKFNILSLGTAGVVEQYTIRIGTTATTSLAAASWETVANTVYGPVNYQPVAGINSFTFTSPFVWNGTDNIIIEICNGDPASTTGTFWTNNPVIAFTTGLSFNGSHTYRADNLNNLCATTTTTENGTPTTRPNIIFTWTPSLACAGTPNGGTAFTSSAIVCAGNPFTLSATGYTLASGINFQWQSSSDNVNFNDIPGATSFTFNASQTATSYYRLKVTCTNGGASANSTSVLVTTPVSPSGTFTINSALPTGGTNFQSFNDAYNYIKCGIGGAVTFNVAPGSGPYNEQLIMNAVPGASATNTITFNGNGATLSFLSTDTDERGIIKLDGADHVRIDSLVINVLGTSTSEYGFGVHMLNSADSNTVSRCTINLPPTTTSANYAGVVLSGSATSATSTTNSLNDGNIITDNIINGGYYGITLVGSATPASSIQNNRASNNTIRNYYFAGIYVSGTIGSVIEANDISRADRAESPTTLYGIYFTSYSSKSLTSKNRVHAIFDNQTGTTNDFYGIYHTTSDATAGNEHVIVNNAIYDIKGNGTIYGIYNNSSDHALYYHNTISLDAASAGTEATRGFYQLTTATGIVFRNNIVSIVRGGTGIKHAIYMGTAGTTFTSNNNDLFVEVSANNHVGYNGTNQTTLANWQTATSQDANSVSADPAYIDPASGNLRPTASAIDNLGSPVGITSDILNAARSATTPDIGAWEFSVGSCVTPPIPGTATSSATGAVCPNTLVSLGLTGNTIGIGQTYQWETSASLAGPWVAVSGILTAPSFDINPAVTAYYRAAVTCSGNTTFSTPVQVLVNTLFGPGTFTINKAQPTGGTNFASFNDAYDAMRCGIAGPIVFNVVAGSGPYNEQLIMQPIQGASGVNTITFNGNGNTITFLSTNTNERAVIKLNGTDHVKFDNLVITATGTTTSEYGWGIQIMNDADSNTVSNCTININTTSTSGNYAGIVMSISNTSATGTGLNVCDYNTFSNNTITGGQYGITLVGSTSDAVGNNKVINNTITDFYQYGVYLSGTFKALVEGNNISRPTRATVTAFNGIYVTSLNASALVTRNRISNPYGGAPSSTSAAYGIYFNASDPIPTLENIVTNNAIYNFTGNGDVYGLYNSSSNNTWYYHNTISMDGAATGAASITRGFYQVTTAAGIILKNNIITITRTGPGPKHALYFATAASDIVSDRNNLFRSAGSDNAFVGFNGTSHASLTDWQTATSQDTTSVASDPIFANAAGGNFSPTNASIDNLGLALGVAVDINNAPRSATTPDIGAWEFTPGGCVAPPTAGTPTALPDTVCVNTNVALKLTGNSTGIGQTYQWETATVAGGPFTPVGNVLNNPDTIIVSSVTLWWRVAVTCSGNTSYSTPVQVVVNPALPAGTYTINAGAPASATNFVSFNAAKDAMSCGIAGPVVFNVVANSGPYNEQLILDSIAGTSSVNTITFNGNGNTIKFSPTVSAERAVIKMRKTDHVTFDSLAVDATGGTYGYGVQLINNADSNTFRKCTIITTNNSTSTDFAGFIINGSETDETSTGNTLCDANTFDRNTTNGGYYGLTLLGSTTAGLEVKDNQIINNNFLDYHGYGVYLSRAANTLIRGNNFSRPARTTSTTAYGVYVTSLNLNTRVDGNRIHNMFGGMTTSTSTFYGIYFNACDATAGSENVASNNAIYNINHNGAIYGLYNSSSDNVWFYHNTVSLDHAASTATGVTRGFYQTGEALGIIVKNNIITIRRGGAGSKHAIYFNTSTSTITSNRNDLYVKTADNNFVGYNGADRTTLAEWQTATSQDANSISMDPVYTDAINGNLTPIISPLDNIGEPVGITVDILGVSRSATTPDIGAFEFNIAPCVTPPNAGTATANPNSGICIGSTIQLNLAGNTAGGGQTYQWQMATTAAGPWTNIGGVLYAPEFSWTIGSETFFRAEVVCSGNTVYSVPVQVVLNPSLLAGTYTINGAQPTGGTNYQTFTEAVAALECGITGTVIFEVAPGTYNEQIRVHAVAGTSPTSRVIFRSANGNASSVNLTYNATSAANWVINIDSARYFSFNAISITATNSTYGRAISIANNAAYDSIANCIITVPAVTATSNQVAGIFGTDLRGSDLVIRKNTVNNGAAGIYIDGTSTTNLTFNHQVDSNTVNNAYQYGIYTGFTGKTGVTNNTVNVSAPTNTTAYGIYGTNADSAYRFVKNLVKIENTTATLYGIYLTACDASLAEKGTVANNRVVAVTNNTGNVYGLYQTGASYNNTVNNVLAVKTTGATSYGLYSTASASINYFNNSVHNTSNSATNNVSAYFNHTSATNGNIDIQNNVFSHGNNGWAMQMTNIDYLYSDYNTLYTNGSTLVRWESRNYGTIHQWRDTSGWDYNSIVYKPAFVSDSDLSPDINNADVWAMHGRGVQIPGNNYDFNNNARPTTLTGGVPDMGAYEFLPGVIPPALQPVPATPANGVTQTFMFGTDTVTKITWAPTGPVPSSIDLRRYSGVLPPGMPAAFKPMYFYTDVDVTGTGPFNYNLRQWYVDSWQGFVPDEATIRLGRTDPANVWLREPTSSLDDIANVISKTNLTTLDKFTGVEGDNVLPPVDITPVNNSNKGTKFWVAYGHHQFFGTTNSQQMVLYLGAEQPAVVTVRINGTTWSRTYNIPANTVITSSIIPKLGLFDARLMSEGLYKRGISITSDVPITAYAHIYGSLSSGATMLMPVGTYGYEYYALTSRQNYDDNTYSWFYVVADRDNTVVEITPSNPTLGGRQAGVPFTVTLKKGEVYQVLGAIQSGSEGYDLTGSKVKSVANSQGKCFPVAVFSGSSRTNIACTGPGSFSGDNIIQQNFPFQAWGKRYLTAPTSASTNASTLNPNIYRIAVKDASTVVRRNGVVLTGLINNYYYQFTSNTADYIESDKPVMVAQFMPSQSGSGCTGYVGNGDPEMMYISPLEQGIKQVALYRNNEEAITVNFLTLIIPTNGIPSLRIDGSPAIDHSYPHPNLAGYTVVVKRWTSAKAQTIVQSDSAFTAITYGMGNQESYGYNAGTMVRNLNALPAIINVYNETGQNNEYTCAKTPFRVHILLPVKPTKLEWLFSLVPGLNPNVDSIQNNPVPVDSVTIDGRKFYKFTVNMDFTLATPGTFYLPIAFTHPDVESCNNRLETAMVISVIEAPVSNFTVNFSGCVNDVATFNGTATTSNNVAVNRWVWDFGDATSANVQNPTKQYTAPGTYNVKLRAIADDGCIGDSIKPVVVNPLPVVNVTVDSLGVCTGANATFNVQNPVAGVTYNWYDVATGGVPVGAGNSFTVNNVTTKVVYYVEATQAGCVSSPRKRIVAVVLPPLTNPVASLDSAGVNFIRFRWNAVPNAASYEVSTNGGTTWTAPSSGTTGLTHTVSGLQPLQVVNFRVRAIGVIACQTSVSLDVSGRTLPDQIFIPNAFTPNGDGLNDVIRVYGYVIRDMHFMIFNQWGEKVFETRSQSQGWDGRHKGKVQPSGVYAYVIKITMLDGRTEVRRGSINLLR